MSAVAVPGPGSRVLTRCASIPGGSAVNPSRSAVMQAVTSSSRARSDRDRSRAIWPSWQGLGDRAVAEWTSHARARNGKPYDDDYAVVFRVTGGRIAEVTEYCDTSHMKRVLFEQ